ncbi:MAG: AAC(3) family N-acetyltransferase [Clostridia bacterium]|nr:AAC(3) family N-acetyltransferase [Clostridia bacterium]
MLKCGDIHNFLRNVGIKPDDTVIVHTSMRALGEVEGGCDGLIDAFCSYLSDGLFVVPTHTWNNVTAENPVYDVRTTLPCIGALPSVAAFRPDGVRSLHPTHSVAAFGKRAREFVSGEERATSPCPVGGVWARLYDEGAKILLLGVKLNRNTYIHAVDEMLDIPNRLAEPIPLTVIDYEGTRHEISFRKHCHSGSEYYDDVYRRVFEKLGVLKNARLGNAEVGIFDTVRGTEVLKLLWSRADCDLCQAPREIPEDMYKDI